MFDGPFQEERLLLALYEKYSKEMLKHLTDTAFSLNIMTGKSSSLLVIYSVSELFSMDGKTRSCTLPLSSKASLQVIEEIYEFPNDYYMDHSGHLTKFAEVPKHPLKFRDSSVDTISRDIREIIEWSFRDRMDFNVSTGGLLSGGMNSSVINYLASKIYREKFGQLVKVGFYP